eukprot:27123-Pelagomonas_calceolata.AAC.2
MDQPPYSAGENSAAEATHVCVYPTAKSWLFTALLVRTLMQNFIMSLPSKTSQNKASMPCAWTASSALAALQCLGLSG